MTHRGQSALLYAYGHKAIWIIITLKLRLSSIFPDYTPKTLCCCCCCWQKSKDKNKNNTKNLRLFLFLPFTRRDIISMRAVLFGLAPHGEVLGDERLHQALHLGGLLGELLHLTARWAPRRGAAHHCSDLLSLERRNTSSSSAAAAHWRLSTTTTSALSGWGGGKRTWTNWLVT